MSDKEFAEDAAVKLGIPTLKETHVWGIRTALEIPSNRGRVTQKGLALQNTAMEARFKGLEGRVKLLEQRIEVYLGVGK